MADYAKGDVLLELRKKTGLTREKAAAELGFTTKTLFTWEKENGGIRPDNARKLAEFYGIEDPSTLLTSTEDGGDQLDRIEQKLDTILAHLGLRDPAELLEQELAEGARTAPGRDAGTARVGRARQRANR